MHFRCVFYFLFCCVLVGLDWAKPMMNLFLHVTYSWILMHTSLTFYIYFIYFNCFRTFWVFLSPPLLPFTLVASWHLSISPLRPRTLFILRHLLPLFLLTLLSLSSGSVMRRPNQTSLRTFHDAAFIRNAKSFCQIFLTLTYPLSSTVGVGSHYVAPQSCALPWSYKIFTPICTNLTTPHLSLSLAFEVCTW